MIRSIRGPILGVAALAVVVLLLARFGTLVWIQRSVSAAAARELARPLWFHLAVELLVVAAILLAVRWLIDRDRRDRLEKARVDHLAEVAAMSGGFAHEARNLLNAMQTRIELLRKSIGGDDKATQRLNKLDELAQSMEQLFTDFLTFTRPADDELEETDVAGLLRQVLEFEELELERAGIEVICQFADDAPRPLVDRAKLKRALLNLVVNSRQAMPNGGQLCLRVLRQGKRVRIEVQDSGCGIDPNDQPKIFQTYYTTKGEGTGLGLAIVRRTIEDLGGEIFFTSTPNAGTIFTILLPSAKQHRARVHRRLSELARQKTARLHAAG